MKREDPKFALKTWSMANREAEEVHEVSSYVVISHKHTDKIVGYLERCSRDYRETTF